MSRRARILIAVGVTGLVCGLAAAQSNVQPPAGSGDPEPPVLRSWLTVVLAGGAVVVASLIPAKRGHQD